MASHTFTVASSLTPREAFTRLVDLTTVGDWDAGVTNSHLVSGVGGELGAEYEVTVTGFDGAPTQVVYRLTEVDAPSRFVMVGATEVFRAHDTLEFVPTDHGSMLTYVGTLELLGDDPPLSERQLDSVFPKIASVAQTGLIGLLNP